MVRRQRGLLLKCGAGEILQSLVVLRVRMIYNVRLGWNIGAVEQWNKDVTKRLVLLFHSSKVPCGSPEPRA